MWTLLLTTLLAGSVAPQPVGSEHGGPTAVAFIRVRGQQELRLTCGGGEGLVKSWLTPFGEVISPGQLGDPVYMRPDGTLTLSRTSSLHSGRYHCLLQHQRGSTMFIYDLEVDPGNHQNQSKEISGRSRRRVRSVMPENLEKGHLAASVAASLTMTFVVGFSFGALSRTPFSRCFEAITRRFKSPQRARRSSSLDEDSDVTMATLPPTYDNQAFQVECDGTVKHEEQFVPPKPQRSFRSKPVDQEATVEMEGCDFGSQEEGWWRKSCEEESKCSDTDEQEKDLVAGGEEMWSDKSSGREVKLNEDGGRVIAEEKSQQEGEDDWRTRVEIGIWSDGIQLEERGMRVGGEEDMWGDQRTGEEEKLRREEELNEYKRGGSAEEGKSPEEVGEDWRTRVEFGIGMWSDAIQVEETEMKVGGEEDVWGDQRTGIEEKLRREKELNEHRWGGSAEEVKSPEEAGEDWRTRVEFGNGMWSDVIQVEETEMKVGGEEVIWGDKRREVEGKLCREKEGRGNKVELDSRRVWEDEISVNMRIWSDGERVEEQDDVEEVETSKEHKEEVKDQELLRDQGGEVTVQKAMKNREEVVNQVEMVSLKVEEHREDMRVQEEMKEVKDQEDVSDKEEEVKVQEDLAYQVKDEEGEEVQRIKSEEDDISELSSSDSEEETGGEIQEETQESPPPAPSPPRGRRSRVIRLYQYDEEGQLFSHLPTSDPTPRLKQRSASLTRLSAIMAAATAGPMDAPRTGSGTAAEEKTFFHMEI
ncbi:retinitis pigmentosa 1-like 1 protein [Synchiropus splendidus]|uniref:retinitis pigmentosa 1-like 1 protein n=1 Tax=Synchiropus splendidus TaxID=270530 RepID=UPI00237DE029|nr:retinitis pigmentosa 1-like 1 protein [Synchiropus splendidus]